MWTMKKHGCLRDNVTTLFKGWNPTTILAGVWKGARYLKIPNHNRKPNSYPPGFHAHRSVASFHGSYGDLMDFFSRFTRIWNRKISALDLFFHFDFDANLKINLDTQNRLIFQGYTFENHHFGYISILSKFGVYLAWISHENQRSHSRTARFW